MQEMPVPVRSAPGPPINFEARFDTVRNDAGSGRDFFGAASTTQLVRKKKPPPRPPPPKFKDYAPRREEESKKAIRPTELLTNLFGRKTRHVRENATLTSHRYRASSAGSNFVPGPSVSLIDLSPPDSPTFATRSSSDGASVDSFGSDGNSNPSIFASSGGTSRTESAFEDDFDFFSSLSKGESLSNDPWKVTHGQDPFSPTGSENSSTFVTERVGESNFFTRIDVAPESRRVFDSVPTMPTIIRARPPKPPAPKILNGSRAVTDLGSAPATRSFSNGRLRAIPFNATTERSPNFDDDPSPPMPSIPPPAPPSEYLELIENPTKKIESVPHGTVLYDFAASHPGDLSLKQGETVTLLRAVNDEWLEGQIGGRVGIFPSNFIDVVVPLPGHRGNIVNALYAFPGETWEDLSFEEGARITVLSRISEDWLYGEYRGKKGQFPANHVDRVPHNLSKSS